MERNAELERVAAIFVGEWAITIANMWWLDANDRFVVLHGDERGVQPDVYLDDVEADGRTLDESAIASVVENLVEAWRRGDGTAWGECFTQDADFTTWFGLRLAGRDAIASGHQEIFDTFYANTVYELKVESVRFLNDDVALVALLGSVVGRGQDEPSVPQTVPLAVLTRDGTGWKVAAFQNTYAGEIETRRVNGDLRHK